MTDSNKPTSRRAQLTTVQLPVEVYQLLKELAEQQQRSVSSYARLLIVQKHSEVFSSK